MLDSEPQTVKMNSPMQEQFAAREREMVSKHCLTQKSDDCIGGLHVQTTSMQTKFKGKLTVKAKTNEQ